MGDATEIKRVYQRIAGAGWVKMTQVAEHLDLTPARFSAAVRELIATDPACEIMPESNQKTLTAMDRLYRVRFAGDDNDLICWL